jgi:tetratricopeptide (TPR) repeat protein
MKLFQKRDYARARELFRDLVERYPMEPELIDRARGLMAVCEKQMNTETAHPGGAEEHCTQGVIHLNAGEVEEALDLFRKAAGMGGGGQAWYLSACALAQTGRAEEALDALRKAVSADPSNRSRAANEKDFDSLREHPGYDGIVAGARSAGR